MSRTADAFIEIVEHCYPGDFDAQEAMEERICEGNWLNGEIMACGKIEDDNLRGFALADIIHKHQHETTLIFSAFKNDDVEVEYMKAMRFEQKIERDNNSDN